MKLFLVRHGESDETDQITAKGREESAKNALALKQFHPEITTVYHSTKMRAKETAEIFHEVLCHHTPLVEKEGIKPIDAPEPIADELSSFTKSIMVVSHLPFLEKLTSLLLHGNAVNLPFTFEGSSVVILEKNNHSWQLIGMVSSHCFDMQKVL